MSATAIAYTIIGVLAFAGFIWWTVVDAKTVEAQRKKDDLARKLKRVVWVRKVTDRFNFVEERTGLYPGFAIGGGIGFVTGSRADIDNYLRFDGISKPLPVSRNTYINAQIGKYYPTLWEPTGTKDSEGNQLYTFICAWTEFAELVRDELSDGERRSLEQTYTKNYHTNAQKDYDESQKPNQSS